MWYCEHFYEIYEIKAYELRERFHSVSYFYYVNSEVAWSKYGYASEGNKYHINIPNHQQICSLFGSLLTHWGRDKMAAILQTTFWSAFPWISCLWFNLQYDSIGADNDFAPNWHQTIICSNDGMLFWRIYASMSRSELMPGTKKTSKLRMSGSFLWVSTGDRWIHLKKGPGGRLNKKDGLTRYGDSHVKDKTS